MRPLVAAFGVLMVLPTAGAAAQVRVNLEVGPLVSSRLVRDSIVTPLSIRLNPALAAGARVTALLSGPWRVGVLARVSRSDLELKEGGTESRITTLTVWHAGAVLARALAGGVSADATVGVLLYQASSTQANLFQDGEPRPIVWGIGVRYELPVSARLRAGMRVAYDGHRFGTPTLRINGFRDKQFVHRVFVGVILGWHGAAPAQP